MRDKQVVGYRDEKRVALLQRSEARQITCSAEGRCGYHPISNPASRRTGASEARILLRDVRSWKLEGWRGFGPAVGSLWRDVQALAEGFDQSEHQPVEESGLQPHQISAVALQGGGHVCRD